MVMLPIVAAVRTKNTQKIFHGYAMEYFLHNIPNTLDIFISAWYYYFSEKISLFSRKDTAMNLKKSILIFSLIIILFANISVSGETTGGVSSYPMLAPRDTWYRGSASRNSFTTITILDSIDSQTADSASESWNAAVDHDGDGELNNDIVCYVNDTELIIAGNGSGKIFMNFDSTCSFSDLSDEGDYFSNVTEINGMDILDTSNVVLMKSMFLNACSLDTVDVSGFDTSNVSDMSFMFASTVSTKEMSFTVLDVSNWDTSSVTTMNRMFQLCSSLEELNVSRWNTSKVTTMSGMFQRCKSLRTLDVSNWNTSNIENLSFMFHCENMPLGTIDVSNWDVSKVLTFDHFIAHAKLTLIGVENWKNSVVVVMNAMFHMSQNTVLDVSGFDTSNVITFDQMFEGCNQLTEIIGLENFDTSNSIGFSEMFASCQRLKKLNLESFDTRKAANDIQISSNGKTSNTLYRMFADTLRLKEIKLGENFSFNGDGTNTNPANVGAFRTPSSTYITGADGYWYNESGEAFLPKDIPDKTAGTYYALFPGSKDVIASGNSWYKGNTPRSSITKINITDSYTVTGNETEFWDASSLQDNSVMCYVNGTALTIAGSKGSIIAHKDSSYMFSSSDESKYFVNLESIDGFDNLDTSLVTNMNHMFKGCSKITTLDLSSFDTSDVKGMEYMFHLCKNLKTVDISGFDTGKVTTLRALFYECNNLETADISSFDTSSVTNMNGMFRNCTDLNTIYVSRLFSTKNDSLTSDKMFTGCKKLIGGNGTVYNSNYVNSAYAVIDTDKIPGYFTEKEMTFANAKYLAENNKFEVTVLVSEEMKEKNGVVIIALYGNNGMINSCCTNAEKTITHTFENLPMADGKFTVKAFYWTGIKDIVPICIPITKTIQK